MISFKIDTRGLEDKLDKLTSLDKGKIYEGVGAIIEKHVVRKIDELGIVDTGAFKASVSYTVHHDHVMINDGVHYGCVFGAHVQIHCEKNKHKTIGQVEVGDRVLTQDGNYNKVIGTRRFLATEKPELVEIVVEYRKDRVHTLTLTQDHKVMVQRDKCSFWVEAKELKEGDGVFSPNKINYNTQRGNWIKHNCKECGISFEMRENDLKYRPGIFCSRKCQLSTYNGKGNPNFGNKLNDETKKQLSKIHKDRLLKNPEKHPSRIVNKKGFRTRPEKEIKEWLDSINMVYSEQKSIQELVVDFFIEDLKLIIEADGAYWHSNQDIDIQRDKRLLEEYPDFKIIHIHFTDKRFSKDIDPTPLPNVFYIQCNDSMNSFVDLTQFTPKKILSVRNYEYKNNSKNKGQKGTYLYDLMIEDMHSFVASGILIANSHLEYGTRPHVITPKDKKALSFTWSKAGGKVAFTKVIHPGTQAYAPFRKGLISSQVEITQFVRQSIIGIAK